MALMTAIGGPPQDMIRSGQIYADGWREGGGESLEVLDKSTGAIVATVGTANTADVRRASISAGAAQRAWAHASAEERVTVLNEAARIIRSRTDDIVNLALAEMGATHMLAHGVIASSLEELRNAAALPMLPRGELYDGGYNFAERIPIGVVGVINPWNNPFFFAWRALAPAFALGNAVVLKPDPNTPLLGGLIVAEILHQAGLPEGLLQVLPGGIDVGEAIVSDPGISMISFTGSSAAGLAISRAAGLKRTQLELGGDNAFIVLGDADIEAAASSGAFSSFIHQGQGCVCAGRHLVHESVADAYTEALTRRAGALKVGDPHDPSVQIGPVINERQVQRIEQLVDDSVAAGAQTLVGGHRNGAFFPPTVMTAVTTDMPVYVQEVFGPVAPIVSFRDDAQAIEMANDTQYGLVAAIHTGSPARGLSLSRRLATGMVHINGHSVQDGGNTPFGGLGASGNGTRFGGTSNLEAFTQWRWTTVNDTPAPSPF